jgi:hypothetical protein
MQNIQVAVLAAALLKDQAYTQLIEMASPFVKERCLFLERLELSTFCWSKIEILDFEGEPQKVLYQILDKYSTHSLVTFPKFCIELYLHNGIWTVHNIIESYNSSLWHESLNTAKRQYSLAQSTQELDEYWDLYDIDDATTLKRPISTDAPEK